MRPTIRPPRRFACAFAVVLLVAGAGAAPAQNYPSQTIKIVVPFPPGGGVDVVARVIAPRLSESLGQSVIVENRAGAGGLLGTAATAQAAPDGYTLTTSSTAYHVIAPVVSANPGFDPLKDFTHIAYLGGPPSAMVVHPKLGVKTFQEFVALARKAKEPITYISPGTGSHGFLVAEYVAQQSKYQLTHIPYKGAGPAVADLIAGHVLMGNTTFSSIVEQIRAKRVIPLAVTTEKRIAEMPDMPTFKE